VAIKEGILKLPSGRWAICLSGHAPIEITSGETFRIEVDGELKPTRMEFAHGERGGGAYNVDDYPLRNGHRLDLVPRSLVGRDYVLNAQCGYTDDGHGECRYWQ
jgi:hypothetical protein